MEFVKREFLKKNVIINDALLEKNEITKPLNSWVTLAVVDRWYCLAYKTPFAKSKGRLAYLPFKNGCQYIQKPLVEIKNIDKLSISLNNELDKLTLKINLHKPKKEVITLPLLSTSLKRDYKKLDHPLDQSYLTDVFFGRYEKKEMIADGRICHGVNASCQNVVTYRCDQCKSGFYEVVDFNCLQGGSKYCGIDKCGEKNQPACPRGYNILETKLKSLCIDGSPAGFCNPGLKTFCNEDKILICL